MQIGPIELIQLLMLEMNIDVAYCDTLQQFPFIQLSVSRIRVSSLTLRKSQTAAFEIQIFLESFEIWI